MDDKGRMFDLEDLKTYFGIKVTLFIMRIWRQKSGNF